MGRLMGNPMARQHNRLTAVKVRSTTAPGMIADGGGLYLQISKWQTKTWIYRFMLNDRRRDMGLGSVNDIPLAEARDLAREARRLVKSGIDPIAARDQARTQARLDAAHSLTFDQCAARYIKAHRPDWSNPKHAAQWETTLATYAAPTFGPAFGPTVNQRGGM